MAVPAPSRWWAPAGARHEAGVTRYDGLSFALFRGVRPLLLDVWVPPRTHPPGVVVWVHGGGWREGDRRYLPPTLAHESLFTAVVDAGLALVTVDYRLSGEATFPAQLHDVKSAIRYVRRYAGELGIDGGRIGVGGESAGGHLAALAALTADDSGELEGAVGVTGASSAVACAALWYPFLDARGLHLGEAPDDPVAALLGGRSPDLARRASPAAYVAAGAPPFLLVHGEQDTVVPIAQSEQMRRDLDEAGVPVELRRIPGAGHCFDGWPDVDGVLDHTVDFWVRHLGPG
ncbi:alpha/beta hydrolase [Nakamurella endophytica]|uniref:BD-FAE-like domain-containing protein n=1 Tax=Nakamurella endophytica TaxID=1748367 RepID=A0A917SPL6_9ACTN|nr:alpha/beta hydrolase [Nakamurella endophytica]GGL91738.1 hypothetical protein GCM10011594_09410 [Nakamurella endophytica]